MPRPTGGEPERVYSVCMARVNVYLPDDLARDARAARLSISSLAQRAIEEELARRTSDAWLDRLARLRPTGVNAADAVAAVRASRENFGTRGG